MSILQQIINEATSSECDVTRMLRLCQVLAVRLGHEPLRNWVRSELEGYQDTPPPYRKLITINRGNYVGSNYQATYDIPLSVLPDEIRHNFESIELRGRIAEYVDLAKRSTGGGQIKIAWPIELAVEMGSKSVSHGQCIHAWQQISPSDLIGVIDQVKTGVLGFALDIERAAPNAGDIPGIPSGVSLESVTQIFMTNIHGTIGVMQTGADAVATVGGLP